MIMMPTGWAWAIALRLTGQAGFWHLTPKGSRLIDVQWLVERD